jgi:hypothetical protein
MFKLAFWLLTLPFRLVFGIIGLALWVLTLPVRMLFGILALIGFGNLLQLGVVAGIGYFFYRLVSEPMEREPVSSPPPPSNATLQEMPST